MYSAIANKKQLTLKKDKINAKKILWYASFDGKYCNYLNIWSGTNA